MRGKLIGLTPTMMRSPTLYKIVKIDLSYDIDALCCFFQSDYFILVILGLLEVAGFPNSFTGHELDLHVFLH
jgi:hypothetical protein